MMKLPRRKFLPLAAGAAALAAVSRIAGAQTYPSRPITMIVPFPPGGLTDVLGRVLAAGMQTSLGQSVVVESAVRTAALGPAGQHAQRPTATRWCWAFGTLTLLTLSPTGSITMW
jgi:tripartite-type tricarboxylate transporter receptor subunit TctC